MSTLEEEFNKAIRGENIKAKAKGYNPTYLKKLIGQRGGLGAAKYLLSPHGSQDGLYELWDLCCLDESVEALVLQNRFRPLFTDEEIREACRRLEELDYFTT